LRVEIHFSTKMQERHNVSNFEFFLPIINKSLEDLVIITTRHNSHFTDGHINVIVAKVIIRIKIPIRELRLYVPNLSKLILPNYTVPRPRRQ